MKKIIILLCVIIFIFIFVIKGCSNNDLNKTK